MFTKRDIAKKGALNLKISVSGISEGTSSNENFSDKVEEYLICMRKQHESKDGYDDIQNAVTKYKSSFFSVFNSNELVRRKK